MHERDSGAAAEGARGEKRRASEEMKQVNGGSTRSRDGGGHGGEHGKEREEVRQRQEGMGQVSRECMQQSVQEGEWIGERKERREVKHGWHILRQRQLAFLYVVCEEDFKKKMNDG